MYFSTRSWIKYWQKISFHSLAFRHSQICQDKSVPLMYFAGTSHTTDCCFTIHPETNHESHKIQRESYFGALNSLRPVHPSHSWMPAMWMTVHTILFKRIPNLGFNCQRCHAPGQHQIFNIATLYCHHWELLYCAPNSGYWHKHRIAWQLISWKQHIMSRSNPSNPKPNVKNIQ